MSNKHFRSIRKKIIFDLFDRFPDYSNMGTAKIAFRDHPEIFENAEYARRLIRLYRGASGGKNRDEVKFRKYYR